MWLLLAGLGLLLYGLLTLVLVFIWFVGGCACGFRFGLLFWVLFLFFWWFVLNCLVAAYSAFIVVYGLLLLVFGLGVVRLLSCLLVWFNVI